MCWNYFTKILKRINRSFQTYWSSLKEAFFHTKICDRHFSALIFQHLPSSNKQFLDVKNLPKNSRMNTRNFEICSISVYWNAEINFLQLFNLIISKSHFITRFKGISSFRHFYTYILISHRDVGNFTLHYTILPLHIHTIIFMEIWFSSSSLLYSVPCMMLCILRKKRLHEQLFWWKNAENFYFWYAHRIRI